MPHYAAFHLGLHCLSKYLFRGFWFQWDNRLDSIEEQGIYENIFTYFGGTGEQANQFQGNKETGTPPSKLICIFDNLV